MIDFKKIAERIEAEQGYCNLSDRHYAAVDGIRTHNTTNVATPVKVHWLIDWHEPQRPVLRFLDGVTGYESFYVDHMHDWQGGRPLSICAGTPGRWDSLSVDGDQVKAILNVVAGMQGQMVEALEVK